jgi:hypothetical protein
MWSTAFEAAPLIKPPALRGVLDIISWLNPLINYRLFAGKRKQALTLYAGQFFLSRRKFGKLFRALERTRRKIEGRRRYPVLSKPGRWVKIGDLNPVIAIGMNLHGPGGPSPSRPVLSA